MWKAFLKVLALIIFTASKTLISLFLEQDKHNASRCNFIITNSPISLANSLQNVLFGLAPSEAYSILRILKNGGASLLGQEEWCLRFEGYNCFR